MSGHAAVQSALRNHYFDSLGLPRRYVADPATRSNRRGTRPACPVAWEGRRRGASPYSTVTSVSASSPWSKSACGLQAHRVSVQRDILLGTSGTAKSPRHRTPAVARQHRRRSSRRDAAARSRPALSPSPASFADQPAFERWIAIQPPNAPGLWIKFAKKLSGIVSLSKAEAIDTALCHGCIDGQLHRYDEALWLIRFTPRKPGSRWSQINRMRALQLVEAGRMRASGLAQIEAAKADGRRAPASSRVLRDADWSKTATRSCTGSARRKDTRLGQVHRRR
jgi:hypothetical protein